MLEHHREQEGLSSAGRAVSSSVGSIESPTALGTLGTLGGESTSRVSASSSEVAGTSESDRPTMPADGRYLAFQSWAASLVAGDTNDGYSASPAISAHGRYVAFASNAAHLVRGDTTDTRAVFVRTAGLDRK